MNTPRRWTPDLGDERGSVLPLVVLLLVVCMGMSALAIDMGMLYTARSEAQRAVDAGAHAGAAVFLNAPGDEEGARSQARAFAEANRVRQGTLTVLDQDIDVVVDSQKVRARVYRAGERGNPVTTFFARILGVDVVDVGAFAAAQAWPALATECILPFAIPDHWYVNEGAAGLRPAEVDDVYDPDRGDVYVPAMSPDPDGFYTGYGASRVGQPIVIKPSSPGDAPQPGWYYPIRLPGSQGADDYRESIKFCWQPSGQHELGDDVDKEPGNMQGPTRQGFRDILEDPHEQDVHWDEAMKCPRKAGVSGCLGPGQSRRIRPLVMFDPQDWQYIDPGAKPVPISGFAGVFIESMQGDDVVVRWMHYAGVKPVPEWGQHSASLLRVLRIVE